jgi:hypothetical protein
LDFDTHIINNNRYLIHILSKHAMKAVIAVWH